MNMDYEEDDRPEYAIPEPIDDVLESEIVRRQGDTSVHSLVSQLCPCASFFLSFSCGV